VAINTGGEDRPGGENLDNPEVEKKVVDAQKKD
jgi:hypothetical protein